MSLGLAAIAGAVLLAAPSFEVEGGLEPKAAVEREARAAWESLEAQWRAASGGVPAPRKSEPGSPGVPAGPETVRTGNPGVPAGPGTIRITRERNLPPGQSGTSRLGYVGLRQNRDWTVDEPLVLSLRHELAHQFLWAACPAATGDALFHEAFALATSGELEAWAAGEHLSLTRARQTLERGGTLDARAPRRALARALLESRGPGEVVPKVLLARVRRCGDGARWQAPLGVAELFAAGPQSGGDAFVVISRHSGELLWQEGEVQRPRPIGSTLKPFLVAGAGAPPPPLAPRPEEPEWRCVEPLPRSMDWRTALLRSCNGYFLDWAAGSPSLAGLGSWGPVLAALGAGRAPRDAAEAIGLRATLAISPAGLAHAYRLLAEARPDLMEVLGRNAADGTLAGLPASARLAGLAIKTGTVRDSASAPLVGWIVAVDADRVAVMARAGAQPRDFASAFADAYARVKAGTPGAEAARVQVFALVGPEAVQARCPGLGVVLTPRGPRLTAQPGSPRPGVQRPEPAAPLLPLARSGAALCLGAAWRVRPSGAAAERDYAGIFAYDPAPPYVAPEGARVTEKQGRARRGSDLVFRTSRLLYTAGVLQSEDASLAGEPRAALARIVAHNAAVLARHAGRPVCDTTHCQVFGGTVRPWAGDAAAVAQPVPEAAWLPFSAGGEAPWREARPAEEVERLFGGSVLRLDFRQGVVAALVARGRGGAIYEETSRFPCEPVRSALRLPSCPSAAARHGARFEFEGRGAGHGLGLDLSRARRTGAGRQALVEEARRGGARPSPAGAPP